MSFFKLRASGLLLAGLLASASAYAQTPRRPGPVPNAPSDEQSYNKEFVFGINFNDQGGLLGGVSIRSSHVLDDRLLRFWSLEGVMLKNRKEIRTTNRFTGGTYIDRKTNHAFVLRPSFGMQRILFRKAADAGVQVNGLLSAGPSLGLLMPYYIIYDRTSFVSGPNLSSDDIVSEPFSLSKHTSPDNILDHGPLFSGISQTQVVPGFHLRGGLSFEYGRYRDAVAGLEAGFILEGFTKRILILSPDQNATTDNLNRKFLPSVYLTLYFGHRS